MENKTMTLKWSVSGEFITRIAKEWFYIEHRPYEKVEELLLSCMCGTDIPQEKLKAMAQDVILGRAEFVGNTSDDTFTYTTIECPETPKVFLEYNKSYDECKEIKKRINDLLNAILYCTEDDEETALCVIEDAEDKFVFSNMLRNYGKVRRIISNAPLVDDYLEAQKTEDNYGWLEPNGRFYPVEWCEHQDWALKKIKEQNLLDEFRKYSESKKFINSAGDFLCQRGWILLHNPAQGTAKVTRNETKRITKAQSEFLFDYYTKRGKHDLAKQYLID